MSRTKSPICSSASSGGRMTTSTPSPRTVSSKSVTRAATSTRASDSSERPVISQSIQTMRSVCARSSGVDMRAMLGRSAVGLGEDRRGPARVRPMSGDLRTPAVGTVRSDPTTRSALRSWVVGGVAVVGFLVAALVVVGLPRRDLRGADRPARTGGRGHPARHRHPDLPVARPVRVRAHPVPRRRVPLGRARGDAASPPSSTPGRSPSCETASDPDAALATTAVLVAPVVEEALKGVFVLLVWWFLRREFDGVTDGMVYAGVMRGRLRLHREHPVPRPGVHRGRRGGPHRHLRRPVPALALRPPDVHDPHGHRGRGRRDEPDVAARDSSRRSPATPSPSWHTPCGTSRRCPAAAACSPSTSLVEVPVFLAFVVFVVWARQREGRLIGQFLRPYADAGWLSRGGGLDALLDGVAVGRPGSGPGRTAGAGGCRRCGPSRTPRASSPCCAAGCTTTRRTPTRSAQERELLACPHGTPRRVRRNAGRPTVTTALDLAHRIGPELVALRRRLHRAPEIGLRPAATPRSPCSTRSTGSTSR